MKKVLIANRGEIAVRIARACADYGVESVAVYADADMGAIHTRLADEAYALQGNSPAETYLNIAKVMEIARRSGADAVHPGYGFLSENAEFARAVLDAGLIWIGPSPHSIDLLGNKVAARKIAKKAGAPLVEGTAEPVQDANEVLNFAQKYGLPIAIKAAYGGGGRGLKVAWRMDEVVELFESATREAVTAFGHGECFLEQFLDRPRHVEAQVLADQHGHVLVLGTRDCSLQRRNQKLVEEAPAPFLTDAQSESIHNAAKAICLEAGYVGAGTVEFLLSAQGVISFLEVNTRLQVEHTVTEEVLGLDLVVEQLRIADGLALDMSRGLHSRCHALEFRINAEDPGRGFIPTPGLIEVFKAPSGIGIRLDSGVESGSIIPGMFDSMMAKLIITGTTREQAISRARRALKEFKIEGVASTLPFFKAVLDDDDFIGAHGFKVHTRWIETDFASRIDIAPRSTPGSDAVVHRTVVEIDGKLHQLGLPEALLRGVGVCGGAGDVSLATGLAISVNEAGNPNGVKAPISGNLQSWLVNDGDDVKEGDHIAVMEAMKMEMQVSAHKSGKLSIKMQSGSFQNEGTEIAFIE